MPRVHHMRDPIRKLGATVLAICSSLALPARADKEATGSFTAHTNAVLAQVVAIDWSKFKPYGQIMSKPRELRDCATIFLNSLAYNLGWATNAIGKLEGGLPLAAGEGLGGRKAHNFIRPACNVAFGLAVALQTRLYDEKVLGVPKAEAQSRAVRLIQGVAREHRGKG